MPRCIHVHSITVGVQAPGVAADFMDLHQRVTEWLATQMRPAQDRKARYQMDIWTNGLRIPIYQYNGKRLPIRGDEPSLESRVTRGFDPTRVPNSPPRTCKMRVNFRDKRDAALFKLWFSDFEL